MLQREISRSLVTFSDLGLSQKVVDAVRSVGYIEPTPIQEKTIPYILQRRDVLGIAQTGTGKTASFVLPMLTILEQGRARARMPRTLVLEPTRELAAQVAENFSEYGTNHCLDIALLIGGISFEEQERQIKRGTDVLIATPGRLFDHFERGTLLLTAVELLVIDEADRMLDMGFIPDIDRICKKLPFTRQTLFFSATMAPEIEQLTKRFLHSPEKIEISYPSIMAKNITQYLVKSSAKSLDRRAILRELIHVEKRKMKNAIVFCNRKREVSELFHSLLRYEFNVGALHGDMDQHARTTVLSNFKNGSLNILVASDIAARGLDIPNVSHVFNFNIPPNSEDYIHRIGRTGRAGRQGKAFTLVAKSDLKYVKAIKNMSCGILKWLNKDLFTLQEQEKINDDDFSEKRVVRKKNLEKKTEVFTNKLKQQHTTTNQKQNNPYYHDNTSMNKDNRENEGLSCIGFGDDDIPAFMLIPLYSSR